MPIVSIIVPNFNHSNFLDQRISSILSQAFQDFEIILLDDCSDDNSIDILKPYKNHPKVSHLIINEENSGSVFRQWKKGLEYASGKYIWFAESDDWADKTFLSSLVSIMEGDDSIGLAYCDSNVIRDNDVVDRFSNLKSKWFNSSKWKQNYLADGLKEIEESLLIDCTINNASAVLLRRKLLAEVKPFDLGLQYTGDWYTYLKVASISKVAYLAKALNNYREHEANVSKNARYGYVEESSRIFNWMRKELVALDEKTIIRAYRNYIVSLYRRYNFSFNIRRDLRTIGKTDFRLFLATAPTLYLAMGRTHKYYFVRHISKMFLRLQNKPLLKK